MVIANYESRRLRFSSGDSTDDELKVLSARMTVKSLAAFGEGAIT